MSGIRGMGWSNVGPTTYYTFDDNYDPVDSIQTGEGVFIIAMLI